MREKEGKAPLVARCSALSLPQHHSVAYGRVSGNAGAYSWAKLPPPPTQRGDSVRWHQKGCQRSWHQWGNFPSCSVGPSLSPDSTKGTGPLAQHHVVLQQCGMDGCKAQTPHFICLLFASSPLLCWPGSFRTSCPSSSKGQGAVTGYGHEGDSSDGECFTLGDKQQAWGLGINSPAGCRAMVPGPPQVCPSGGLHPLRRAPRPQHGAVPSPQPRSRPRGRAGAGPGRRMRSAER